MLDQCSNWEDDKLDEYTDKLELILRRRRELDNDLMEKLQVFKRNLK